MTDNHGTTDNHGAETQQTFVIIGAGQAGAIAAAELRKGGFQGRLVMIGDEPHLPYERPPLSKDVMLKPDQARITIHPAEFYAENGIETRLGVIVETIDREARQLKLSTGESLGYDRLLLATGARARRYPLLDALGTGVFTVRTLADAQGLRAAIRPGARVLIVGGGIIGLEVAASSVMLGATVTVIERGDRLMARSAPPPLAEALMAMHRERGVAFHFGAAIVAAERTADGTIVLSCEDGRRFEGDVVVYGIGVELNVELARAAGLSVEDGIVTDEQGRTSDPAIFAAGDVARQWNPAQGRHVRQETWLNAQAQAIGAAHAMLTGEPVAAELPWYWTDQYDRNFQVAGAIDATEWRLRGEPSSGRYTLFGLTDGRVTGAITVNNGREMRPARQLLAAGGAGIDTVRLCDPKQDLRKLVAAVTG